MLVVVPDTVLPAIVEKGKNKRKRVFSLDNGNQLDLMSALPVTPEVLAAMRKRILELEDEVAASSPAKRARTTNATEAEASTSAAAAAAGSSSTKADEKKRKAQVKKVFDRLKKECKSNDVKFQGSSKTIKFDEVYSEEEFNMLFKGKGVLIQPTPENKPKSTVTIIEFRTQAQIQTFFGDELKPLQGNNWTRGGIPARTWGAGFGGMGSTFTKSTKIGPVDITIRNLDINYSKNNMKCTLKFEMAQVGGGSYSSSYDDFF